MKLITNINIYMFYKLSFFLFVKNIYRCPIPQSWIAMTSQIWKEKISSIAETKMSHCLLRHLQSLKRPELLRKEKRIYVCICAWNLQKQMKTWINFRANKNKKMLLFEHKYLFHTSWAVSSFLASLDMKGNNFYKI